MKTGRVSASTPSPRKATVRASKALAKPKPSAGTKASTPEQARNARRELIGGYIQRLFSEPWMQETLADLHRRQPKSMQRMAALQEIDVSSPGFWPFFSLVMPLCIERAEGGRLLDIDGNEYTDFFLGFGSQSLHGHNPEPVVRAVKELMGKSVGNGYCSSLELEYVRLLKEFVPHREKFAFQNSGSDASSAAIRLARSFTGRRLVVRFEGTVNGQYDVMSYNGHPALHGHPLMPFPSRRGANVQLQSFNRGAQVLGKEDLLILNFNDPASLDIIKRRKNEIACVLTEPVPLSLPYPEKVLPFVRELSELCRKTGVILILDEIHTGFRYGPSGMTGAANLHADLVVYGKVLTGLGLPLSAVAGRADIMNLALSSGSPIHDYGHKTFLATTHINNHLSIAASHASLSLLKEKGAGFYERTRQKVDRLRGQIAELEVSEEMTLSMLGFGEFFGSLTFMRKGKEPSQMREFIEATNPVAGVVLALLLRRKGIYFHGVPYLYTGDAHSQQELDALAPKVREALQEMKQNGFSFSLPS